VLLGSCIILALSQSSKRLWSLMLMLVVAVCGLPMCRHFSHRQLTEQPWLTVHSQWLLPRHGTVCRHLSSVQQHCQAFIENSRRFRSSREVSAGSTTSIKSLAYRTKCINRHFFDDYVQCHCNFVKCHYNQFLFNNNNKKKKKKRAFYSKDVWCSCNVSMPYCFLIVY